jgi:hypothetical protein
MEKAVNFNRPTLDEALDTWRKILKERGHATDLLWLFEENLCFEKARTAPDGWHPGFQTRFTPPPDDALDVSFGDFGESTSWIVFYRLGTCRGKSVCVLLCDSWFEKKSADDGFLRRDDWKISFRPGIADEIEEITDLSRWVNRVKRGRALHDLDFCMSLATVDEIKTYARGLAPYERFAEAVLNRLRRMLGQPA